MIIYDKDNDIYYFPCPHCTLLCQVKRSEISCNIFRHAVFKQSMKHVPPHSSKEDCERWWSQGLVYGCAKPFKFDGKQVKTCDYI